MSQPNPLKTNDVVSDALKTSPGKPHEESFSDDEDPGRDVVLLCVRCSGTGIDDWEGQNCEQCGGTGEIEI